jgi:hypothetical protein
MPFEDANPLPSGLYYAVIPHELKESDQPVISTTRPVLMLVGEDMKYRDDMHLIRQTVGEMQGRFPNIQCAAFVLAKAPGDVDGSWSRQGIFFSFQSGRTERGDLEMIQSI